MDPFVEFKEAQRKSWAHFAPFEMITTQPAAKLVGFARVQAGQHVLDVGCGTGVVALTARGRSAQVTGLDLTPELLARARDNATISDFADIHWQEGDVEALPYPNESFDVVLSQFGHMFAPRPDVAISEMLRVLKPGGTIAFSTWPPELFTGRMFELVGRYLPPLPQGAHAPSLWGDPAVIRERLSDRVRDIVFDRGTVVFPVLSVSHHRVFSERAAGPVLRVAQLLQGQPEKLAEFRREYDALAERYISDNALRQDFLMTRAIKR